MRGKSRVKSSPAAVPSLEDALRVVKQAVQKESALMVSKNKLPYQIRHDLALMETVALDVIISELQEFTPTILSVLEEIVLETRVNRRTEQSGSIRKRGVSITLLSLIYQKSGRSSGHQAILSLIMVSQKASKCMFQLFNALNLCLSYDATWVMVGEFIGELTIRRIDFCKRNPHEFCFIMDNFGKLKRVQEQIGNRCSQLLHWTLIMLLENQVKFPLSSFSNDEVHKPQMERKDLTPSMMLPTREDSNEMFCASVEIVALFLCAFFTTAFKPLFKKVKERIRQRKGNRGVASMQSGYFPRQFKEYSTDIPHEKDTVHYIPMSEYPDNSISGTISNLKVLLTSCGISSNDGFNGNYFMNR